MADFVFNRAKGRVAELVDRVYLGDPAVSRLYVIPVDVAAITDATLKDLDDFAAIITAGVTELTTGGWSRKTITAADLTPLAPDDALDRMSVDIPNQTWATVTTGDSTDLVICYAAVAAPTNAQLLPLTQHDFPVTPTGAPVIAETADFFRAS